MAPKEIRFLRHQIDVTQAELAARLRVDDQTVARWEKEQSKMPGPADMMLRVLYFASDAAQPEGAEVLKELKEAVGEIIGSDQALHDEVTFKQDNSGWSPEGSKVAA